MTQNKSNLQNQADLDAGLKWVDDTIPLSTQFDDTYYSKADGLAETKHTFLEGNNLAERFSTADTFTIAELGFGTGLNFLAAKRLWETTAPKNASLHYISFEQYPMSKPAMLKSLSRWPKLEGDANSLASVWTPEFEMLDTHFNNVRLTVLFSDANTRLNQMQLAVDAWFLDGFSPAKNPELWNEALMHEVGKCTKPQGTFATYTSAGFVRRNLKAAGFEVKKVPGHAGKREMSVGTKV